MVFGRFLLAAALAAAMLPAGCAPKSTLPPLPPGAGQWVWEGTHRIDGVVEVPAGVTLRLLPGTVLKFVSRDRDGDGYGDSGLRILGNLVAAGREGEPILLTSDREEPSPGDWAGLLLDNVKGAVFEYCTIEYARHALHSHFSEGSIRRSRLVRNIEGTRLGDSRFKISYSLIADNESKGLNFRACANHIHHNTITRNGHGIFLFETDTESLIEQNNIFGNEGYDFRLGDFYRGDAVLSGNWWGTDDDAAVRLRIYEGDGDRRGRVRIAPASSPVKTGWERE